MVFGWTASAPLLTSWGAEQALVRQGMASFGMSMGTFYALYSLLSRMSQMPHSVSAGLQLLPKRIFPGVQVHWSL